MAGKEQLEKATFAAGCFWGVEASFWKVEGVVDNAVGYTGRKKEHPTYGEVCSGMTGHAEAVQVTFDPSRVSYEKLLAGLGYPKGGAGGEGRLMQRLRK